MNTRRWLVYGWFFKNVLMKIQASFTLFNALRANLFTVVTLDFDQKSKAKNSLKRRRCQRENTDKIVSAKLLCKNLISVENQQNLHASQTYKSFFMKLNSILFCQYSISPSYFIENTRAA